MSVVPISREDPRLNAFRTLPHNVDAEKALLGAIFVNNQAYESVSGFLRPDHFALDQNGRIFDACAHLIERGKIADPVTLKGLFEQDATLTEIGGIEYLAELAGAAVGLINAREYARLIHGLHLKRELIAVGDEVIESAYKDIDRDASEIWFAAEAKIEEAGLVDTAPAPDTDTLAHLEKIYQNPGQLLGVPTGFKALDNLLSGFQPEQLILLASRPSMGKTTLAVAMASKCGARSLFLSLEQSRQEIELKMISDRASVPLEVMRHGNYRDSTQFERIVHAANEIRGLPMKISGRSGMSPQEIRAAARRHKKAHGLDILFVDQLTHISPPDRRTTNRVHQIGEILKMLKSLARELNVPLVLLHQLSRAVEGRENKRPALADLRDSGEIEQDADVVMFIFREAYYLERNEPPDPNPDEYQNGTTDRDFEKAMKARQTWERAMNRRQGTAEIIVDKQRMGPIDAVTLHFDGRYSRFGDLGREQQ